MGRTAWRIELPAARPVNGGPAPPVRIAQADSTTPAADLYRRLAALVYEIFLLAALVLVAGFAILPAIGPAATPGPHTADQLYVLPAASRALLLAYYVAVTGAYCLWFWSAGRQTLAMKTWHLVLVQGNGRPVAAGRAARRFAAAWIGPLAALAAYAWIGRWGFPLLALNFAWALVDRDRQFLHDRIAGTRVVQTATARG